MLLETGDPAIDFTLHDYPDGNAWNLRRELEGEGAGKPVVLIWGMYTCPAFQGMGDDPPIEPWDMCGYRDEYDLVRGHVDLIDIEENSRPFVVLFKLLWSSFFVPWLVITSCRRKTFGISPRSMAMAVAVEAHA